MADSTTDKVNQLLEEEKRDVDYLFEKVDLSPSLSDAANKSPAEIMTDYDEDLFTDLSLGSEYLRNQYVQMQPEQETGGVGDLLGGVWAGIKRQGHNYLQIADLDNADIELPNQNTYLGNIGDAIGSNALRLATQVTATAGGALMSGPGAPAGAIAGWAGAGTLNTWMVARETYKSLYEQAIANGATEEMAQQAAYEGTVASVGYEAAANLVPVGKIGGLVKGTSTAAKVGRGALMVSAEAGSEGVTEGIQQKIENEAVNRNLPFGRSIDTNEGVPEAIATGAIAAGITKGSFDVAGGVKSVASSKLKSYIDSKVKGSSEEVSPTKATKSDAEQINETTKKLSEAFNKTIPTTEGTFVTKSAQNKEAVTTPPQVKSIDDYMSEIGEIKSPNTTTKEITAPLEPTFEGRILGVRDVDLNEQVSLDDLKANPDATYTVEMIDKEGNLKTVTATGDEIVTSGTSIKQPSFNLSKDYTIESDGTIRSTESVGAKVGDTSTFIHKPSGKADIQTTLEVDDSTQKTNHVAASQLSVVSVPMYANKEANRTNTSLKQARADILKSRAQTLARDTKGKIVVKEGVEQVSSKSKKGRKAAFGNWSNTETNIANTEYEAFRLGNKNRQELLETGGDDAELNQLFVDDEVDQQRRFAEIDETNKKAVLGDTLLERKAETVGGTNPDNNTINATLAGENTVNGQPVDYATRNPERPVLTDTKTTIEQITDSAQKNVSRNAMVYTRRGWRNRITKIINSLDKLPQNRTLKKADIAEAMQTLRDIHSSLSNEYFEENLDKQGVADYLDQLETIVKDINKKAELRKRTKEKAKEEVKEESKTKEEVKEESKTKEEPKKQKTKEELFIEAALKGEAAEEEIVEESVEETEEDEEDISPEVIEVYQAELDGTSKETINQLLTTKNYLEKSLSRHPDNAALNKAADNLDIVIENLNSGGYKASNTPDFKVLRLIKAINGSITGELKKLSQQKNQVDKAAREAALTTKSEQAEETVGRLITKQDGLNYLATLRNQITARTSDLLEKDKNTILEKIAALEIAPGLTMNKKGALSDSMRKKILAVAQDPILIKDDSIRYLQKSLPSWSNRSQNVAREVSHMNVLLSPKGRVGKEQVWQGVLNLAKKLGVKIYTDLDIKGIKGRIPKGEMGASDIAHRIANIANSRNTEAANHELGHFIFNDGNFGADNKYITYNDFYMEMDALGSDGGIISTKERNYIANQYDIGMLPEEIFARTVAKYLTGAQWDGALNKLAPKTMKALENFFADNDLTDTVTQLRNTSDTYYSQGAWKQSVADFIDDPSARENIVMWIHENLSSRQAIRRQLVKLVDDSAALRGMLDAIKDPEERKQAQDLIDKIIHKSQGNLTESASHAFWEGDGMQAGGGSIVKFNNMSQILEQIRALDKSKASENLLNFFSYLVAKHTVSEYIGNKAAMDRVDNLAARLNTSVDDVVFTLQQLYKEFSDLMELTTDKPVDITTLSRPGHKEGYKALKKRWVDLPSEKELLATINTYRKAIYEEFSPDTFRNSDQYSVEGDNLNAAELKAAEDEAYKQAVKSLYTFKTEDEIRDTGKTLAEALEVINDIEQDPNFVTYQNAAAQYYDWQDQLLDYCAGQSAEMAYTVKNMRESNTAYHVPLLRHFTLQERNEQMLDELNGRTYELTQRKGSDRAWRNLELSIADSMHTMIQNAHKSGSYEALATLSNFNESGPFIREISIPKAVVDATTKDTMIAVRKATKKVAPQLVKKYTEVANEIINSVGGTVSIWAIDSNLQPNQFRIFDNDAGKFKYYETDIAIADAIRRPDFIEAAAEMQKAVKAYVHYSSMVKSLMTTFNPAFVFWNNLCRDTFSMAVKGAKTGNPIVDWVFPVRVLYAATYQLKTVCYDWILKKGTPFETLTHLGLFANQQHINAQLQAQLRWNAEKGHAEFVGDGSPWGWVKAKLKNVGRWAEMSDRTAQFAQLKWMLNRDGLHIDDIDLTRDHLTHLYANKETLRRQGINLDTVKNILTADQIKTWELTEGDAKINLELSDDQIKQIDAAIDWSKTKLMTESQRIKYGKQIRNAILNFAQGGKFSRFMNHFFIFSKARTNGFVQNVTWIKKNPVRAAAYAAQMWAMGMLHGFLYPDDMDDEDAEGLLQGISIRIGDTKRKLRADATYMVPYAMGYLIGKDDSELGKMVGRVAWSALKNETIGAFNSPNPAIAIPVAMTTGSDISRMFDRGIKPVVPEYLQKRFYGHPEKQINEMVGPLAGLMSRVIPGVSPIEVNYYLNQVLGGAPARAEELVGYSSYLAHANRGASGLLPDTQDYWNVAGKVTGKRFDTIKSRYVKEIEEIAKEALGDYNADKKNKTKEARKCVATSAELVMQAYQQLYWAQTTEEGRREVVKVMSGEAKRLVDKLSGRVYKSQSTYLNRRAKTIGKRADIKEKGKIMEAPKAWSGLIGE